jgi:hypothetical protein
MMPFGHHFANAKVFRQNRIAIGIYLQTGSCCIIVSGCSRIRIIIPKIEREGFFLNLELGGF